MSDDTASAKRSGRDDAARAEAIKAYETAQGGGTWMVVVSILIALGWLGAAGAGAVGLFGTATLLAQPPLILISGALGALVPAMLIITCGFIARANRRTSAAQEVLMAASARLLAPAREAGVESLSLAEDMKRASHEIETAMQHAVAAMKSMATDMGDERHRLESVSYAAADNARDLAAGLAAERQALESLARDLRAHISTLNDAIPRQAQMMVDSAKRAGQEVAAADHALEERLATLDAAGQSLVQKIAALDHVAKEGASRSGELTAAMTRMEERLENARRTVENALRTGDQATSAATGVSDALARSVTQALDQARAIQSEIETSTRAASDEAARSLARLREAGEQAAIAVRNAHKTAREENEALARRLTDPRPLPAMDERPAVMEGRPPAPQVRIPPQPSAPPQQASANVSPLLRSPPPKPIQDDDLFDPSTDEAPRRSSHEEPLMLGRTVDPKDRQPLLLRRRAGEDAAPPPAKTNGAGDLAWRDIISDMHKEEAVAAPPADREKVAEEIIAALQGAHIELTDVFKPRAKRKIAEASQISEIKRRAAVLEIAGKQVDVVIKRLRADAPLTKSAKVYLQLEAEDALHALDQTSQTSRNASPRLAAYLLLDAAL